RSVSREATGWKIKYLPTVGAGMLDAPLRSDPGDARRFSMVRRMLFLLALASAAVAGPLNAQATPLYNVVPLGLVDAEHTAANGSRFSYAPFLNQSGLVAGISYRLGAAGSGTSTWVYDSASGTTTRIGIFDQDHTFNGRQE